MNKRVFADEYSKTMLRLVELMLTEMNLLMKDKSLLNKIDPLADKISQLCDETRKRFSSVQKEIEQIEQGRALTKQEEKKYISQITEIAGDVKPKLDELEKSLKELGK